MKHEYHIEAFGLGRWLKIKQGTQQYLQGFLDARKGYAPRPAYRLMRSDGKVMEEAAARDDVDIGQIAGWPTAEQYERAAAKALELAKVVRAKAEKAEARRAGLSPLHAWPYGAKSEVRVGVGLGKSTAGFDALKALITEHFEGAMVLTRIESGEELCRLHITHNGTDKVCDLRVLDLMSAKHGSGFLLFIIASIRKDLIEDRVKEQTSDADSTL